MAADAAAPAAIRSVRCEREMITSAPIVISALHTTAVIVISHLFFSDRRRHFFGAHNWTVQPFRISMLSNEKPANARAVNAFRISYY